jgi:hypothetical protein
MEHPPYLPRELDAEEALAFTLAYLDGRPSDDEIRMAALFIGEPLVDWHWLGISDQLVDLMRDRADLRRLIRSCMLDPSVPDAVQTRLYEAADA